MGAGFGSTRRNTFDTRDALFRRSSQLRAAREVLVCFGLRSESLLCLFVMSCVDVSREREHLLARRDFQCRNGLRTRNTLTS